MTEFTKKSEVIPLDQHMDQARQSYVRNVLRLCAGSVTKAAKLAKCNRADFYRILKKAGVNANEFRDRPRQVKAA